MGWTVLYIAFGCVALWLLGEVLLQYKARLRWRLLAFCGFLCVVLGVLMASIPVIFLGAVAFGTGQLFVTLSFRRGFSTGWAIGGKPGSSRRRRSEELADAPPPFVEKEPVLEVSSLEETTYQPQPLPDDTGEYGVYKREDHPADAADQSDAYGAPGYDSSGYGEAASYEDLGHDSSGYRRPDVPPYGTPAYGTPTYDTGDTLGGYGAPAYGQAGYDGQPGQPAPGQQDPYSSPLYSAAPADSYGYGGERYGSYSDGSYSGSPYGDLSYPDSSYSSGTYSSDAYSGVPYPGQPGQPGQPGYPVADELYDPLGGGYQGDSGGYPTGPGPYPAPGADAGEYPEDPYAAHTPPGGVWVPHQRESAAQSPYPAQDGDHGYDQRYY